MNRVEEFLQILLAASDARKEAALSVLRGHAQAVERLGGELHRLPIGLRAHNQADQRRRHRDTPKGLWEKARGI